ncbi:hypothetical protein EB008_00200 [bacterium]|nr:hypothetical protein [bacterium]
MSIGNKEIKIKPCLVIFAIILRRKLVKIHKKLILKIKKTATLNEFLQKRFNVNYLRKRNSLKCCFLRVIRFFFILVLKC